MALPPRRRLAVAGVAGLAVLGAIGAVVRASDDGGATATATTTVASVPAAVPSPSSPRPTVAAPSTTSSDPTTTAATTTSVATTVPPDPTTTVKIVAPSTTAPAVPDPPPTSPATAAPATTLPAPTSPAAGAVVGSLTVTHVVDGDTVDVSSGERVRLIGIDTPEGGECGYGEATRRVEQLVAGASVVLVPGARDDVDRYGRVLRYVEADGLDVGLTLVDEGLAVARYDSRDGYGAHPREDDYRLADLATAQLCPTASTAAPATAADQASNASDVYFPNCDAARAAGAAPLFADSPGYRGALDRDKDGVACE